MTYRPKSTFKGISIKLLFEQLRAVGHSAAAAHALLTGMLEHAGTETEPVLPAWWKLERNGDRIAIKTPAGSLDPAEVFVRKNGLAANDPPPAGGTVFVPSAEDWRKYGAQAPDIWRLRAAQEAYARRKAASQPAGKEPEPVVEPAPEPITEPAAEPVAEPVPEAPVGPAASQMEPDVAEIPDEDDLARMKTTVDEFDKYCTDNPHLQKEQVREILCRKYGSTSAEAFRRKLIRYRARLKSSPR
jgi:hypothetical protein